MDLRRGTLASGDPALKLHLRAAAIQAFEFTYELSFKMVKRHLEQVSPNPAELDEMSFRAIMREAFRRGLVRSEVSVWNQYRKMRGTTSHTYKTSFSRGTSPLTTPIDIRTDHLRIVHDVLARHLPDGVQVWVFGSRATWATKDSSDLDLALSGDGDISAGSLAALESAFEDSDLPYAVDVVDVNRIGRRFRRIVERQRVRLPQGGGRRSADRRNEPRARWPDTWCGKTIADVAASSSNAVVGGPFGSNLVSRDYVHDGVPVIRGQNMGTRWVTGDFVFVTPEKADSLKANLARPGDVVLTQRGTLGQVSIVPSTLPRCLVSQSQMKVTVDREVADPQFIYYVLSSAEQQAYVRRNAIQTGVPHTNLGILRSTPIPVPPLIEQRAIARVLGTLDDKIELSRRMNATLEAMAKDSDRYRFADFRDAPARDSGAIGGQGGNVIRVTVLRRCSGPGSSISTRCGPRWKAAAPGCRRRSATCFPTSSWIRSWGRYQTAGTSSRSIHWLASRTGSHFRSTAPCRMNPVCPS